MEAVEAEGALPRDLVPAEQGSNSRWGEPADIVARRARAGRLTSHRTGPRRPGSQWQRRGSGGAERTAPAAGGRHERRSLAPTVPLETAQEPTGERRGLSATIGPSPSRTLWRGCSGCEQCGYWGNS